VPTPRTKSGSSYRGWLALPCRTLARPAPARTQLPPRLSHVKSLASLMKAHRTVRGPCYCSTEAEQLPGSSHEVSSKIAPPPTSRCLSSPGYPGSEVATPRTRSVLAVFHDFDGLLQAALRGFIAPRYRPWGSPGFEPVADSRSRRVPDPPHERIYAPFRAFPFHSGRVQSHRHCCRLHQNPCPSRCCSRFAEASRSRNLRGLTIRKSVA